MAVVRRRPVPTSKDIEDEEYDIEIIKVFKDSDIKRNEIEQILYEIEKAERRK